MRFVCIHGHFYQPPRENPWLEAIELQDSAYPFHDWNERIAAECYLPNAKSRILDQHSAIVAIVNNYASISFNFGPTLLNWLHIHAPEVHAALLEADRMGRERFQGHGPALAQAYNHLIMPLANRRDKVTQVVWGIRDFEHRFGRRPEGMWLPETAADTETLEVLAEHGIRFTVLAPHQAAKVRPLQASGEDSPHAPADAGGPGAADGTAGDAGGDAGTAGHGGAAAGEASGAGGARGRRDVSGGRVDPSRPYLARLPSGREIALFFYDGPVSRAVAFEGLLNDGVAFARRLMDAFPDDPAHPDMPVLAHIATDGESYGHHHRHGDMALAAALRHLREQRLAEPATYAAFLARHPPREEARIHEATSWSCAHGVERWRSDCGCNSGGKPGWDQAWRGPLREALDWLRDESAQRYEAAAKPLLRDPWGARDAYIDVVLDRSPASLDRFFGAQAARPLSGEERVAALKLLELQRHAMLMYTSCGWFFDDISGIETVQVIMYAGRVLQLAEELTGEPLEQGFLERLARARSNLPERGDGAKVYRDFVAEATVDLKGVAAHYAISSLFEDYGEKARVYCYEVEQLDRHERSAARSRVAVGRVRVTSVITRESAEMSYAAVHLGDHHVHAGVRRAQGEDAFTAMRRELLAAFDRADLADMVRAVDRHFPQDTYSLRSLFRDEQRRIVDVLLQATLSEVEETLRQVHAHHAPLMRFVADLGGPLPAPFRTTAEYVLNTDVRGALESGEPDLERVEELLQAAQRDRVRLDAPGLAYAMRSTVGRLTRAFVAEPTDTARLARLRDAVRLAVSLPFEVDLWDAQNRAYTVLGATFPGMRDRAAQGDVDAQEWEALFRELCRDLRVRVP